MPRADTPFARVVSSHAARNHTVNGVRVRWKIVPAVALVRDPHAPQAQLTPAAVPAPADQQTEIESLKQQVRDLQRATTMDTPAGAGATPEPQRTQSS